MLFGIPVQIAMANPNPVADTAPTSGNVLGSTVPLNWTGDGGLNPQIGSPTGNNIIGWNNFDIGSNGSVTFTQNGGWILNNVQAADTMRTGINGGLFGPDCGIIVVNPLGIVFGPQALVSAKNFVGSSLRISANDFMNGNFRFTSGELTGNVINKGEIVAEGLAALIGRNVGNRGVIRAPDGYVIMAAGERVLISGNPTSGNVVVEVAMNNPAAHIVDQGGGFGTGPGSIDAVGGHVILAAGDIWSTAIEGIESLTAKANRDITLNGAISADGDVTLAADADTTNGGDVWAKDDLTAGGHVDIRGNALGFQGDVRANGGDLSLTGRTSPESESIWGNIEVGPGGTLYASGDLSITNAGPSSGGIMTLTGHGSLSLIAGDDVDDEISTTGTAIGVTGSSLLMQQSASLDTADYMFFNQANTDLTLVSDNGWVTSTMTNPDNAADEWKSIGATAYSNVTLVGNDDIRLGNSGEDATKSLWAKNGYIDVAANGNILATKDLTAGIDITLHSDTIANDGVTLHAGQDVTALGMLAGKGALTVEAGRQIGLVGDVEASVLTAGDLILNAGDDVIALGNITVHDGSLDIYSSESTTYLGGDWVEASDDITLHNNTELNGGDQRIEAVSGQLYANGSVHKTSSGNLEMIGGYNGPLGTVPYDYSVWTHDVTVDDGKLTIRGNAAVRLDGSIYSSGNMKLAANDDGIDSGDLEYLVHYFGTIESRDGYIDLSAQGDVIYLDALNAGDYVTAGDDILIRDYTWVQYDSTLVAGDDVVSASGKRIQANGSLTLEAADDIILGVDDVDNHWVSPENGSPGDVIARGDLILNAGDDVYAHGDLDSTEGSIEVYSSDSTTHLWGNVTAFENVLLNNNTKFLGGDQTVEAENGTLTAHGWLRKMTSGDLRLLGGWDSSDDVPAVDLTYVSAGPWDPAVSTCLGNLWIIGEGDVQISGDVTTFGECQWCCDEPDLLDVFVGTSYCRPTGGVGIVSNEGKVYTRDGVDNDTLNVSVTGNSDHWAGLGVDLPVLEGEGKAAILISSKEDLKIGENAELTAYGQYYDDVDDRAAIGFLDTPAEIPTGFPRDEGDPFDVAIYVASETGDVDVSSPVSIMSRVEVEPPPEIEVVRPPLECEFEPKGAMVIDAYDTVTFGADFEASLAAGTVGDRLEVVSRITEWLGEAIVGGTLPYAGGGGPFPPGYTYVLRGAGLGNPAITDGRAWVLAARAIPPLYTEAGERAEEQEFGEGGCPALMEWFAGEVGVPAEDIQIYVADAFASATDLQPCEACARLRDAAMVLADAEDTYIAALAQVVNEFVTTPAPPSEEQMTSIATAFADHTGDGTHYAAAGQWIDALSQYVSILTAELGYAADESAEFADKYVGGVRDMGNESLTAYVEARLAELGG
jgi:filamentous hemagglutinin family protein